MRGDRNSNTPGARLWNLDALEADWHRAESKAGGASPCLDLAFKKAAQDATQYWNYIDTKYSCSKAENEQKRPCQLVEINKPYLSFVSATMSLDLHRPTVTCPPTAAPHPGGAASTNHPSSPAGGAIGQLFHNIMEVFKNAPKNLEALCKGIPANKRPRNGFANRMADEGIADVKMIGYCASETVRAIWDQIMGMVKLATDPKIRAALFSGGAHFIAALGRPSEWQKDIESELGKLGSAIVDSVKKYFTQDLDIQHFHCYNADIQRQKECKVIGQVAATILISKGMGMAFKGISLTAEAAARGVPIAEVQAGRAAAASLARSEAVSAAESAGAEQSGSILQRTGQAVAKHTRAIIEKPAKMVKTVRQAPRAIAEASANIVKTVKNPKMLLEPAATSAAATEEAGSAALRTSTRGLAAGADSPIERLIRTPVAVTESAAGATGATGATSATTRTAEEVAADSASSTTTAADSAASDAGDSVARSAKGAKKPGDEAGDTDTASRDPELTSKFNLAKQQIADFKTAAAQVNKRLEKTLGKIKSYEKRLKDAKSEKSIRNLQDRITDLKNLGCSQISGMKEYRSLLSTTSLSLAGEVERQRPIIGVLKSLSCGKVAPSMISQLTLSGKLFLDQATQFAKARGKDSIVLCLQVLGHAPGKEELTQLTTELSDVQKMIQANTEADGFTNAPNLQQIEQAQQLDKACQAPASP